MHENSENTACQTLGYKKRPAVAPSKLNGSPLTLNTSRLSEHRRLNPQRRISCAYGAVERAFHLRARAWVWSPSCWRGERRASEGDSHAWRWRHSVEESGGTRGPAEGPERRSRGRANPHVGYLAGDDETTAMVSVESTRRGDCGHLSDRNTRKPEYRHHRAAVFQQNRPSCARQGMI